MESPHKIVITLENGCVSGVDFSLQYAEVLVIDKDTLYENACIDHGSVTDSEFQAVHNKVDDCIADARKNLFPQDHETMTVDTDLFAND